MIAGAARRLGRDTIKAELGQIECIDKGIDHPHGIVDVDVVVQCLGKQRRLPPIGPLDEPRHPIPPHEIARFVTWFAGTGRVFTQPRIGPAERRMPIAEVGAGSSTSTPAH